MSRIMKYSFNQSHTFQEVIEEFIRFKQSRGMSERTISDYHKVFNRFIKVTGAELLDYHDIRQKLIDFFIPLSQKAPVTFNVPYSNLNVLFNWCISEGYFSENPIKSIGLNKKRDEGRARHIDESIIERLLRIIDINTYAGLRNYILLLLTLDSGIRPKEAFGLHITDTDTNSQFICPLKRNGSCEFIYEPKIC